MLEGAEIAEVAEQQEHEKNPVTVEREMALEYIAGTEFQDAFIEAMGNKEDPVKRAISLATLQRDYAAAVYNIGHGLSKSEIKEWDGKVHREIFDKSDINPTSLVNVAASRLNISKDEVKTQLIGPTSVLTFVDLWQTAVERRMANVNIKVLQADPEVDVHDKIDLIVETDDCEYYIQLKTTRNAGVRIEEVTDPKKGYLNYKIQPEQAQKMLDYANRSKQYNERHPDPVTGKVKDVKVLAIELPGIDAPVVNNAFGKITDERAKNEIFGSFRKQALKVGMIHLPEQRQAA